MKVVIKELELGISPQEVFSRLYQFPSCFWLDSSFEHELYGRWSFIGFSPFLEIRYRRCRFLIKEGRLVREFEAQKPLGVLRRYFSRWRMDYFDKDFPFIGGGTGYLGYEFGNYLERLPFRRKDDLFLDELRFDFYQFILGYEHKCSRWYLLGFESERMPESYLDFLDKLYRLLERPALQAKQEEYFSGYLKSSFSREQYFYALRRAKEYIIKGDIYQVNLTQRFSAEYKGDLFQLYLRLRQYNPGAYSGILVYPDFVILSSSPELFLKVRADEVITRPIKGTCARGKNQAEDEKNKNKLLHSEKDLAELAMIVDLERNDLGRVCDYGSVEVVGYPELESYSRVHHLVATIKGRLAKEKDVFDLLKATFPGGSITGAPKIRAMEIIDELEPVVRGPYTGSIGWIGFNQNLELNIAIRIMIAKDGWVHFPAGGGIVYDSEAELEYKESWVKALALWEALCAGKKEEERVVS